VSLPGIGYTSQQGVDDAASQYNAISFLVKQILSGVNVATMVQVVAVTETGQDVAVGYVDIQPLVNQVDGANNAVPHGIVHSVPFIRIQGGANAIIIDPQVGDIGIAIFADRDTTGVEANKAQANPGSGRRFDMADAMYIGGLLNGVPSQYVQFNTSGITIVSPTQVELQAPEVQIVAPVVVINASTSFSVTSPAINLTGNVATTGLLTNNTVDVGSPHTHGGVTTGTGRTGFPA
jgi:hypothetical protein